MRSLLVLASFSLLVAVGCTRAAAPEPAPRAAVEAAPAENSVLVAPEDVKVGDRITCMVSGDTFVVEADTAQVEHEGRKYYVCCDGCVDDFRAHPKKFLQRAP
jgi:YHS domain-containing protein